MIGISKGFTAKDMSWQNYLVVHSHIDIILYGTILGSQGSWWEQSFSSREFEDLEMICMNTTQGLEKCCQRNKILLLNTTIYGLKKAAIAYWWKQCQAHREISNKRSNTEPCMHFKSTNEGQLVTWISWVDKFLILGSKEKVEKEKRSIVKKNV